MSVPNGMAAQPIHCTTVMIPKMRMKIRERKKYIIEPTAAIAVRGLS
jgi:hypothetical protein